MIMYGISRSFRKKINSAKPLRKVVLSTLIVFFFYLSAFMIFNKNESPLRSFSALRESTVWYLPSVHLLLSEVVSQYGGNHELYISQNFDTNTSQILGKFVKSNYRDQFKYLNLHDDNTHVYSDKNAKLTMKKRIPKEIYEIEGYFNILKTSTGSCQKLHPFGGYVTCWKENGVENVFDGYKYICMSKELQIEKSVNPEEKCLVMSFGINVDTSFDEAIEEAGCEVFMFDGFNYEKTYLQTENFLHFHQTAIDTTRYRLLFEKENFTIEFDTFENIVINLGLEKRLINVLKMDIEGMEWMVLEDLCTKPSLALIGQIAVEVHANEMLMKNSYEQLRSARNMTEVLRCLEEKGFRRVSYFDTPNHKYKISGTTGTKHEYAGELLMVNSNWFNKEFRYYHYKNGFNFKSIQN